jgi:hypothetical protein
MWSKRVLYLPGTGNTYPKDFGPVVKKFRFTANPLIQGKNLVLSSGAGSRHESRFPQIRYLVAAMIL